MKPNPFKSSAFVSRSLLVTALTTLILSTPAAPLGTAFTYQGRLVDNGSPANGNYDLRFALYDALSAGGVIGVPITNAPVAVSNGVFTVTLDFGGGIFSGNARWLEVGVRTNGSVLAFTPLTPRQGLTPAPNALYAPSAGSAAIADSVAAGGINNTAIAGGAVNSSSIADGSIAAIDLSAPLLLSTFWRLDGNAGTTPGASFLGTPDNNALDFRVNNVRGLRIEPDATFATPNVIGGSAANFVSPGSVGNFIGAGGQIGAGTNAILGGNLNVIGGGWNNTISNTYEGTIAGGAYNIVGNSFATVGGGEHNLATGLDATVPGGGNNTAAGDYSFAAGQHAKANHPGSFVWADNSTIADFVSGADNQFLIRAGFVGINRATRISGSEYFGILAPISNSWGGMYIQTLANGRPFYGYTNPGGTSWTEMDGTDGNKWKLYNSGYWLTVTTSGNVGFGTSTPASPVDILGGRWDLSGSEGDLRIGDPAYRLKIGVATGGDGAGDAYLRAQGGTSRIMLGSDTNNVLTIVGTNVGIGTIYPTAKLEVAGTAGTDGIKFPDGSLQLTAPKPVFSNGYGQDPWSTNRFLAPPVIVTVTGLSQQVLVTANKALGSIPGAQFMNLYIGYRVSGSVAAPVTVGGGIFGNKVAANTRVIMGMSGVITGLAPGSYEVGLVGVSTDYANWNSNEWGYTTAVVY